MERKTKRILWLTYDAIFAIIAVAGCIYLFIAPISSSTYENGGSNYEFNLGTISFEHFEDGTLINEGNVGELTNYPTYAAYMILAGQLLIFISAFLILWFLSKNAQSGTHNKQIRIASVLNILISIIGLLGLILTTTYKPTLEANYGPTQYSIGFIISIVYFSVLILLTLIPLIKPDIFCESANVGDVRSKYSVY